MIISTVEIIHNKTQHRQGLVRGVSKPGGFATPYSRTLNTAIFTFVVKSARTLFVYAMPTD